MKFESTATTFSQAISLASRFVQKQGGLPVLNSLLLSAEGGVVVIRATNLECGIEISTPAKVSEGGVVAIPSAILVGFSSTMRGASVSCEVVDGVARFKAGQSVASIKTIPHDEFPTLPRVSAENSFVIKADDLARAIRSVLHCASMSTVKPELQSVLLWGEGKLVAVATDSFRLAEKQVPLKGKASLPRMLIPARNAGEMLRILETTKGDVEVYYNDNQLSFHVDQTYFTSRLLDGTFPNYQQILPNTFATEAVVLKDDLAQALKSLAVFTDKFQQISFSVNPKEKSVTLSSHNADIGEEECSLKAAVSGDEVKLTFNSRYLADGLIPVAGESVKLQISGPGKPLLIRDTADASFLYLAMPMNR